MELLIISIGFEAVFIIIWKNVWLLPLFPYISFLWRYKTFFFDENSISQKVFYKSFYIKCFKILLYSSWGALIFFIQMVIISSKNKLYLVFYNFYRLYNIFLFLWYIISHITHILDHSLPNFHIRDKFMFSGFSFSFIFLLFSFRLSWLTTCFWH